MLDEMDADYEGKTTTTKNTTTRSKATHEDETTSNRVIGGYKATLTSEFLIRSYHGPDSNCA